MVRCHSCGTILTGGAEESHLLELFDDMTLPDEEADADEGIERTAAGLLTVASRLDMRALAMYREVVSRFPNSPQASLALTRIRRLEGD